MVSFLVGISMQNQYELEQIDPNVLFDMTKIARERTWQAVRDISSFMRPGMTEKAAIKQANAYFADHGVRKFWHKTHIRFGRSTVLSFDDPYHDEVVLQDNDIFFLDIGPIWNGVEGDCGETFVMGENAKFTKIRNDLKSIFDQTRELWKREGSTGLHLYQYAEELTKKMGYLLHPSYVKGHRLSEFSHFNYTKLGTGDLDFCPSPERWVLEFQICDPSMQFGAFYEDLLD